MVGSEFGVKNMKAWIILSCLNGSGWWWWCNGTGDIFLAHFGPLSTNWAAFKRHSLPEYCCWPCPSLYDYSVPIFWCTSRRIMHHVTKLKSSQTGFLNMTMSSLYSNGLHNHNHVMLSCQYWPKSLRNVSNTLLNLCHDELRQFWRQKGVQPGTSKVYLIKWPVS